MANPKKEAIVMLGGAKHNGTLYPGGELYIVGTGSKQVRPEVAKIFKDRGLARDAKPEEIKGMEPAAPVNQKEKAEEAKKKLGEETKEEETDSEKKESEEK